MTPEQKQLEQIEGRLAAHKQEIAKYRNHEWAKGDALHYYEAPDDVDFLLSLVKSQEATPSKSVVRRLAQQGAICRECLYSPTLDLVRLCQRHAAIDDAATSMRSACIEKVRAKAVDWQRYEMRAREDPFRAQLFYKHEAAVEIIKHLESLSIEQPKE